jgi:hypothetical protein
VRSALSTLDPAGAIEKVQQSGALRDPECEPLLGLLDHMGQSRAEARRAYALGCASRSVRSADARCARRRCTTQCWARRLGCYESASRSCRKACC